MPRFVGFPSLDICAMIDDAPGGGDLTDPAAPRNAPAISPASHLDKVWFHSGFDYYRIAAEGDTTISHGAVAGVTTNIVTDPIGGGPAPIVYEGQVVVADHLIVTHGLGYVPRFFLAYSDNMMPHGFPVQRDDAYRIRLVSAYATTTAIRLREVGYSSASTLSSASRTYHYMVFETVAPNPALPLFSGGPGFAQFGRGMVDTTKRMLRVARPADTPYGIMLGNAVDWRGGGTRFADADGNLYDFGTYSGSFAAPASIAVGS